MPPCKRCARVLATAEMRRRTSTETTWTCKDATSCAAARGRVRADAREAGRTIEAELAVRLAPFRRRA